MISSTKVHDVEIGIEVMMMRCLMMRRRMMHRRWKLQRWKNGNGFSNPERIERRKHVRKGKIVVDLDSFVALATPKEAAVVEHVFGEGIEGPEVALTGIAGLARYFDETIV